MTDTRELRLGAIEQSMLMTLGDRAVDARRRRSLLRDARAVEIAEAIDHPLTAGVHHGTVLRGAIYDAVVRAWIARHPAGTVIELGSGLNTRFDRLDNGRIHWVDLDLADAIGVRRRFFVDTDRRRMLEGSVLSDDWHDVVAEAPAPYLFVSEGVLVYLPRREVDAALSTLAGRFPGAAIAFETYNRQTLRKTNSLADNGKMTARLLWTSTDPHEFEPLGMRLIGSVSLTRPPREVRRRLPLAVALSLPAVHPFCTNLLRLNVYRALTAAPSFRSIG